MVALSETTELIETHDVLTKKDLVEKQVEPIVDVSHDATNPIVGATNPHVYVMQTDARLCLAVQDSSIGDLVTHSLTHSVSYLLT